MEARKAAIANRPKIWSLSRRSLMNQCPRAWILKYGLREDRAVSINTYATSRTGLLHGG